MTIKTADKYGLRERAILVKVTTKMFGTQKKDTEATDQTAHNYAANRDQVAVTKSIINRKNPIFKKIDKIKGLIRNTHLAMTGPWQDDGFRIISTQRYTQWRQTMDDLTADFNDAVDDFINAMPDIKAEARTNLGTLFDDSLIPSVEVIRASFSVGVETEVLPDRTNTIMDLDKERTDQIIAEANAKDVRRTKELTEHTHKIVRDELNEMIEALSDFGNEIKDKKRTRTFRDSLVKRMAKMADVLPGLNITGDPKLDKLAQDIAGKLTIISAAALRGDKVTGDKRPAEQVEAEAATKREEVVLAAKSIVDDLDGIFGNAN